MERVANHLATGDSQNELQFLLKMKWTIRKTFNKMANSLETEDVKRKEF